MRRAGRLSIRSDPVITEIPEWAGDNYRQVITAPNKYFLLIRSTPFIPDAIPNSIPKRPTKNRTVLKRSQFYAGNGAVSCSNLIGRIGSL